MYPLLYLSNCEESHLIFMFLCLFSASYVDIPLMLDSHMDFYKYISALVVLVTIQ